MKNHDVNIKVSLTEGGEPFCFKIEMVDHKIFLHGGSLIDLQHKINLALLKFIAMAALDMEVKEMKRLGINIPPHMKTLDKQLNIV